MIQAFGIGIPEGTGWICRAIFTGGYYANYGGDGYTKQDAVNLMLRWCINRPDWVSTQLFMCSHKPRIAQRETKKIICSGHFERPMNYTERMLDSIH